MSKTKQSAVFLIAFTGFFSTYTKAANIDSLNGIPSNSLPISDWDQRLTAQKVEKQNHIDDGLNKGN